MHLVGHFTRSAKLMNRMVKTSGIHMRVATVRGDISVDVLTDGVVRCADRLGQHHCAGWLVKHAGGGAGKRRTVAATAT